MFPKVPSIKPIFGSRSRKQNAPNTGTTGVTPHSQSIASSSGASSVQSAMNGTFKRKKKAKPAQFGKIRLNKSSKMYGQPGPYLGGAPAPMMDSDNDSM